MRNTLLKIGEMAELNHVSTQTLRLYSKNKLLEPQYMDPETGYRYYTLEQCAKLDLIRALKSCHLPLGKIREIFELSSEERLLQVLEEQIGALSEEIYNSSVSRNNLLRIRRNIQTLNALPPFGQVFFEYVPERKLDVQNTEFDFFSQGYQGYENMLRHMQNYLHEKKLPPSYFINVGTIMDKEHFMEGTYTSQTAFIFVDDLYPDTGSIRTLPQSMYLSVASDNTSLEAEYANRLYEEMTIQDMISSGDSMIEVAQRLKDRGGNKIFMCSTFGLFTNGLEKFDEYYEKGYLDYVITTNLNYRPQELFDRKWYLEADMSKYTAAIINSLNHDRSISASLSPTDKIQKLVQRRHNGEI